LFVVKDSIIEVEVTLRTFARGKIDLPGENLPEYTLVTGAQPKAGTGHKMQSVPVVFEPLHCAGYIADLLLGVLAGSLKSYPPF